MNRRDVGLLGEWRAARYLKRQGMRILKRRYRAGRNEIDLIARDQTVLADIQDRDVL